MGTIVPIGKESKRFEFGKNWHNYLLILNDRRIKEAEESLKQMLEINDLRGKSFLDIGSGSGLFSLAARRLGAKVHSFDYDLQSVACTSELKNKYFAGDINWTVEHGDVLDSEYLYNLGQYDIVYSWGVLHHSGDMWQALENVASLLKKSAKLFIAIYNDQGGASKRWLKVKKVYNHSNKLIKLLLVIGVGVFFEGRSAVIRMVRFQNPLPFKDWKRRKENRGMSVWYDLVDWVGGYPFEVAKPEEIFNFYRKKGLILEMLNTCAGGQGCNEYVFKKI